MATKAQVEQLESEKRKLENEIMRINQSCEEVIAELVAKHENEIAQLKADMRPATIADVKTLINEAIHLLSLSAENAPWDSDDGCDPSTGVTLYYGDESLGSANI